MSAAAEDIAAHLLKPSASPDIDNAPTVITQPGNRSGGQRYPSDEIPSVAGRKLGHFELIEAIGSGGMAAVLKARDLDLGRVVALKILPPESARDSEGVTRFKQEARAAAMLDHENIARVYFCGEDQGLHFIAFEFVEGVTLRALIDSRGPLAAAECVRYMQQIAAGLGHAADRGVVHRDIKPSNILITPDGRAKIVDMGLARRTDMLVNGGVTQSGVTLGTFDFISPEQALDPRRADVRSDIYSLGCTIYLAVTGRPPVPEGTAAKKLHAHQHIDPVDPRDLNPAVPDALAAVLARMMAKDPARRYQTPADLIADLNALEIQLSASAGSAPGARPVVPFFASPAIRPAWVLAVCVAVASSLIFILATSSSDTQLPAPQWTGAAAAKKKDDPQRVGQEVTPSTASTRWTPRIGADGFVSVATTGQLRQALTDPAVSKVRLAGGIFDLSKEAEPLRFEGKDLELAGSTASPYTELIVAAVPIGAGRESRAGGLTVAASETLTIRDLRVTLAGEPANTTPSAGAGLLAAGTANVSLVDCVFHSTAGARQAGAACVAVTRLTPPSSATLRVERCLFGPGGVGVQVPSGSTVTVDDSGFAPQMVALLVSDPEPDLTPVPAPRTTVRLSRSSFMLDPGFAVVSGPPSAGFSVAAGYCVFAPANSGLEPGQNLPGRRGAVVRAGETIEGIRYEGVAGQPNAYYRVDPISLGGKGLTFEECQSIDPRSAEDAGKVELKQRPWEATNPVSRLSEPDPFPAFGLRVFGPTADRRLFTDDPSGRVRVVGARFASNPEAPGKTYRSWPPFKPALPAAEHKIKVWRPTPPADNSLMEPNEYADLAQLLRDLRSNDEVLIRATGQVPVEPVKVEARARPGSSTSDFRVTFKPYPGHHPILCPAPTRDLDAALFKLTDGTPVFEGLEFLIKPVKPTDHRHMTAVSVVTAQGCTFRNCTFTLDWDDEGKAESKAAAVVLTDPEKEMRMDPGTPRPVPEVTFEKCVVRGRGRAVYLPATRPFNLALTNTLTALDGPVVLIESGGKDPGASRSQIRLAKVTAFLGGPILELHSARSGEMRSPGLVRTDVEADACLFAAIPGVSKPFVELDGLEPADLDRPDNLILNWSVGRRPNRYANLEPGMKSVLFRPADELEPKTWDLERWLTFAHDPPPKPVGKVVFAGRPSSLKDLATLKLADVAVRSIDFPNLPDARPTDAGVNAISPPKTGDE